MAKTVISIIVTAYNEEKFIGKCLKSLVNQKFNNSRYEIIDVNDASKDRTSNELKLFYDNIKVINNHVNLGLPSSINKGIKLAKGKYIVRTDADDYVNENYINFLYQFLLFNKHYDAVSCDYFEVNSKEKVIKRYNSLQKPIACGIMWKKDHLIEIGLYDETFLINEEKDLRIRFEKKYKIGHLELPLYNYRRHPNNLTKNNVLKQKHNRRLKDKHKI